MLEPVAQTKREASISKKGQNEVGVAGILWPLLKSVANEGSSGVYQIHKRLLSLAFKNNRKGRVLRLYKERLAPKHNHEKSFQKTSTNRF